MAVCVCVCVCVCVIHYRPVILKKVLVVRPVSKVGGGEREML